MTLSLHEVYADGTSRFENGDITPELKTFAGRLLVDARRLHTTSDFLQEMIDVLEDGRTLTNGQARGVLNVIAGQIQRHRRRFWKSRGRRRDAWNGEEVCIICGGPLNDDVAIELGVGPTCYRRIVGGY